MPLVQDSLAAEWKCADKSEKHKVRFDRGVGCTLSQGKAAKKEAMGERMSVTMWALVIQ